jgi:iron complex transport system permease protein
MRRTVVTALLVVLALALTVVDISLGHRVYSPLEILQSLSGSSTGGATFSIMELRMPRALTALVCGVCFGIAGLSFQTLLGNVLASPDIIGITAGANLAAVLGITVFSLSGVALFGLAVGGGLLSALIVLVLSWNHGLAGSRFILIGIGIAAMLNALTSWLMVRADQWDVQAASRWLTGSLSDAQWSDVLPAAACALVGYICMLMVSGSLDVMRLGTPAATGLGVRVNLSRFIIVVCSVIMLSVATATTGPIAFVSFLSGPIAFQLVGAHKTPLLAGGAVGACLVVAADVIAQHLPSGQVPVGVMTSLVGGPVLVLLVTRMLRKEE